MLAFYRYLFEGNICVVIKAAQNSIKSGLVERCCSRSKEIVYGVIGHSHELRSLGVDIVAVENGKTVGRLGIHAFHDFLHRYFFCQLHVKIFYVSTDANTESRSKAQLHMGIKAFGVINGQMSADDDVAHGPGKIKMGQELKGPVFFNS